MGIDSSVGFISSWTHLLESLVSLTYRVQKNSENKLLPNNSNNYFTFSNIVIQTTISTKIFWENVLRNGNTRNKAASLRF